MDIQQTLWRQLQNKELVTGEYQAAENFNSPWFVKLLLAFSGWLASIFIFAFLLFTFNELVDSNTTCLVLGAGAIFIAYQFLKDEPNEFLQHLMLATSLVGQTLIAWPLLVNELFSSPLFSWLSIFMLQTVLCIVMPNYVHRVCSAFFASAALVISFNHLHISVISSASLLFLIIFLVLNEWRFVKWQASFQAISYGVILLLIPFKASNALGYQLSFWISGTSQVQFDTHYFDQLLLILAMLYLVFTLIQRSHHHFTPKSRLAIIGATICFCLLSMQASGITVGLAILVLGFSNSNKVLQGLGISALLFYISSYYYLLDITLLDKARVLAMMGLFILAIRFALLKLTNPHKQGDSDAL